MRVRVSVPVGGLCWSVPDGCPGPADSAAAPAPVDDPAPTTPARPHAGAPHFRRGVQRSGRRKIRISRHTLRSEPAFRPLRATNWLSPPARAGEVRIIFRGGGKHGCRGREVREIRKLRVRRHSAAILRGGRSHDRRTNRRACRAPSRRRSLEPARGTGCPAIKRPGQRLRGPQCWRAGPGRDRGCRAAPAVQRPEVI